MLEGMFQSTTIPMLEEVVNFAQARHTVLAGNIANLDTPGYQAKDLSVQDFQERLKTAIQERRQATAYLPAGSPPRRPLRAQVAADSQTILRHDQGSVNMETQVSEMVKNQIQHNLAMTIMVDQFHLLQTAIRGTV
ncbi:MAG: flagellar basal body rod protein FlgB [Thermoguttaceae bacterium]